MDVKTAYYLLLVDLKGSTQLQPERARPVFERLEEVLHQMNMSCAQSLVIPLSISYGDEIAGLFSSATPLYDVASTVRDALLSDLRIRFVVSRGTIGMPSQDIRQIGGDIFKQANDAMIRIKKRKRFCCWLIADDVQNTVLDTLTETTNALLGGMTAYQRQVYVLFRQGLAQNAIARKMNKHPQSISDALARGHGEIVLDAERAIDLIIQSICQ